MSRLRLAVVALLASLVAAVSASAAGPPKLVGTVGPGYTTLVGTVGPDFSIKLTQDGKKVSQLKAGKYLFVINDRASIHSFELRQMSGGTLKKELSSVSFTGTNIYTLTLEKGKYKYFCLPHQSSMFGFFSVS